MSSGIFKQAITSAKPHGGVEGFTSANALAGGEGSGGEGAFGRQIGDLTGVICESWQDLPLSLGVQVGWGVSPVAITGQDGCSTLSHPTNFGFLPWVVVLAQGVSLEHWWGKRLLNSFPLLPQGRLSLGKPLHQ